MSTVSSLSVVQFTRLTILSAILGLCIANAIYIKFLHPWFEEIGVCHCATHHEP